MRTSNYNFDIDKHSLIKPVVIIRSGDHDIDTIKITLSNQGEPVDLTNATVVFMGTTPAGNKIIDDVHTTIVDATSGIFEYTFPSAAGSSVGEYQDAYFSIILGNGQTSTMNFRIQVLSGVDISAPAASEYISHYDTMVSNLNSAYDSATSAANKQVAATVSSMASSAAAKLDSALATVNSINSTANNASSAASKAVSMASSVASAVTSQASYINSVAASAASNVSSVAATVVDKIDNLSIGGRNLLLNSKSLWWVALNAGASCTIEDYDADTKMWHITAPAGNTTGNTGIYFSQLSHASRPLVSGEKWVMSLDIKGTGYLSRLAMQSSTFTSPSGNVSNDWTRMHSSGVMTNTSTDMVIYFNTSTVPLDVYIKLPKLEAGNVATDWTPAPEDVPSNDAQLVHNTGNETIAGDKTFTGTLVANNPIQAKLSIGMLPQKDLNSATATGQYKIDVTYSNVPSQMPNGAFIDVLNFDDNLIYQVIVARDISDASNKSTMWVRIKLGGNWANWQSISKDDNVVHKTGNETIAGDKTFTGNVSIPAVTSVITRTVSGTNGLSFKFRRTGNAVHVEISGNYSGTNWTGSSAPSYAAELFNVVVPAGFAPDDWSQSVIIEYGSAVGFGRYGYDTSSKKMTFTYRGAVGGVGSSKWMVSSVTYTTIDTWPG